MTRSISVFATAICFPLGLAVLTAGVVQGSEPAVEVSEKAASDAELSRFLELAGTRATPPQAAKPSPATCEAAEQRVDPLQTLKSSEQYIDQLRKQQQTHWAQKGWTAKEAAAAGEPVVLNGSGYNISGSPRR